MILYQFCHSVSFEFKCALSRDKNSPASSKFEAFNQLEKVSSGLFNYGGSTSWAPIRLLVD